VPVTADEMAALVQKYDKEADGRLDLGELASLLEAGADYSSHVSQRTVLSPAPAGKRARTS
jgi:hypothetical protein